MSTPFESKAKAQKAIDKNYPQLNYCLDVIRGSKAIEYGFRISIPANGGTIINFIPRYEYPPEADTYQEKKSFRTKYRRWKRDFKKELKPIHAAIKKT